MTMYVMMFVETVVIVFHVSPEEWNAATNQIRRIVEPVFVQLRWGDQAGFFTGEDGSVTRFSPRSAHRNDDVSKPLAVLQMVDCRVLT